MTEDQSSCTGSAAFEAQSPRSLRDFIRTESGSAGLLVVAALVALVWANSPWSQSYVDLWHTEVSLRFGDGGLSMDLHHWINDGLMVVFFFVIGLEVRKEFAIGELVDRSRVVVPLVAGVMGMIVPAAIFLALNPSGEAAAGWGAVIGTDTAFLLGVMALVGPAVSTQLRIFLLTLTVIDDIVAVSVIGVVYSDDLSLGALAVAAACLLVLVGLDRAGVWRAAPYVVVVLVLWFATLESGVHASIAGMLSGLLVPARDPRRSDVEAAARSFRAFRQSPMPGVQRAARRSLTRAISVNERLQEALHTPTSHVVVPLFALANAGVDLRDGVLGDALGSRVMWGIVLGLVVGKALGIFSGAWLSVRLGWGRLPQGVGLGHTLAGGALSGIGFTVSLLIISLAYESPRLQDQARVGVLLAAVLASLAGWLAFRFAARFLGQRDAALPTHPQPTGRPGLRPHRGSGRRPADPGGVPRLRVPVLRPGQRGRRGAPRALRRPAALRHPSPAAAGAPARRAGRAGRRGRGAPGPVLGHARRALRPPGRARAGGPRRLCRRARPRRRAVPP